MNDDSLYKKKGFTLIEVLITIAILALVMVIAFVSINAFLDTANEKEVEANEKFILNASEIYANEYKESNGFTKYTSDAGVTEFCISLRTLVNYGIYKQNNILEEYIDDYVVYVNGKLGVYDYELLKMDEIENKCIGTYYISNIPNDEENKSNNIVYIKDSAVENNSDEVPLLDINYSFLQKSDNLTVNGTNNKFEYILDLDYFTHTTTKTVSTTLPVYVALVLDNSGSMNNNSGNDSRYNKAVEQSKKLAFNLENEFRNNVNIGLIMFGEEPKIKREFKSENLNNFEFGSRADGGNTNTSGGIDFASRLFNNKKNEDNYDKALKYTILLYDGQPNRTLTLKSLDNQNDIYYSYLFSNNYGKEDVKKCSEISCLRYIETASDKLKDTFGSKLITIGYDFNYSKNSNDLKKISSQDNSLCHNSSYSENGKYYCYYENTETTSIDDIFSNIQTNISEEVNKTKASKAKVEITFADEIDDIIEDTEYSNCEKKVDAGNVVLSCNIALGGSEDSEFNTSYKIALKENAASCNGKECSKEIKIFKNFKVTTYTSDNETIVSETSYENSPIISIKSGSFYTINDYKEQSSKY